MTARGSAVVAAAIAIAAAAPPAAAQFKDQLVQAPKLAAPERGSVSGALSGIGFTASELARGAFRLPLAIRLPQDRGPVQASLLPAYSPDGGISEWGMGWSVDLAIRRHRLVGEIDFATDELLSPWGRLRPGSDGKLYPGGLAAVVRVAADGGDWLATAADGTQYRFAAASGIATAEGVFSWQLTEVVSVDGERTRLEWTRNASGRPFLSRATWGERGGAAQYELTPGYEAIAVAFVDRRTGAALDRRVNRVGIAVRDAASGALVERWHYQLGYRAAPFGPAFYLETVQRTFRGGASEPAMVYRYELDDARLTAAPLERYAGLDGVLQALGDSAVQPDRAALQDVEADGRPDFEHAAQQVQIQHGDAGWVQVALPGAPGADARCRPAPSGSNPARVLARLTPEVGPPHVLFTRKISAAPVTSTVLVCDRLGVPLADLVVADDWTLGPNTRLVDVDRDRRPDLVRVSRQGVDVLRNESDAQGFRFTPLPRFAWSLGLTPRVSWVNDFDGDGNVDVATRVNTGLWIQFGLGRTRWTDAPQLFHFVTQAGTPLGSLDTFQLTFVDANKDGLADVLVSKGIQVFLFTNRGDRFAEVPVDGFRSVQSGFGLPIAADLTGSGNVEVVFPALGTAHVVSLAVPATGLLASADDGMGTVARFRYARSAAHAGAEHRLTVLDQLTVESSGYDTVSHGYTYGAPVIHTVGKQLVGFAGVAKRSPLFTERVAFTHDDDVAGLVTLSEELDDQAPGVLRFTRQQYGEAAFRGVRWLRPSVAERGHRTPDGFATLSTTTTHTAFERELCPTVTVTTGPSGTLTTTTALASVAAIPDELSCLPSALHLAGAHPDPALDFSYSISLARNDRGRITRATQFGPTVELLVLQDVGYDANHRLASIGAPGRGTSRFGYDAQGRLATVTDPLGVVTRAAAFDPVTDALRTLRTERPLADASASFTYDGRERLQASWDDVSGTTPQQPGAAYTYRDPTTTAPGRIDAQLLVDAVTGSSRATIDLVAADGAAMVSGRWTGDRFAMGPSMIQTRATRSTRSAFVGPLTAEAVAALTSGELRARGTVLAETVQGGLGHAASATRTHQAGVVGTTTTQIAIEGDELVARVLQPGGFLAESAHDAAGQLVRNTDETGVTHSYTYDVLGRLVGVATPDGRHTVRFDGFGRPTRVERDGIGAFTYAYDPATGLAVDKQQLDANGAVVDAHHIAHDALGRPLQIARTAGLDRSDLHFDHDGQLDGATVAGQLGRLSRVRGEGWQRSMLFDPLGRPYQEHTQLTGWRDVVKDTTYRADGTVAISTLTIRDAGGAVQLVTSKETVVDGAGRIRQLVVDGAVLYTLSYDGEGRLARADFASGEAIVFDHDPVTHARRGHQLVGGAAGGAGAAGSVRWERDPRGLIAAEVYTHGAATIRRDYAYDGRGALLQATTGGQVTKYTYTPSGLPSTVTDPAGQRSLARAGDSLAIDDDVYTWDSAGRVVAKDGWTLAYGAGGQLSRAHRPGRELTFHYDEANHRLLKRVNGAPVRADVAGGVLTAGHFVELVVVGGVVAGVLDNGAFTALLTDPRGTPVVGPDGARSFASPYGVRASHLGLAEVIDYARLGWDADLDVVRMGVRDYDARLGQFLTPDPLFFEDLERCLGSPIQCSLYGYAGGNPISFVDPSGMGFWRDFLATALEAVGTVGGGVAGFILTGGNPMGAVAGAALGAGFVSAPADWIRGETPTVGRQLTAMANGAMAEMGGQVIGKLVVGPVLNRLLPDSAPAKGPVDDMPRMRQMTEAELKQIRGGTHPSASAAAGAQARNVIAGMPADTFVWGECKAAAQAMRDTLAQQGIRGQVIEFVARPGMARNGYMVSDLYQGGAKAIGETGEHMAVRVGDLIFDNLNPAGIPYIQYIQSLHVAGGDVASGAIGMTFSPF